ncbi:chaperonin 10-like protein, partial [Endogone sp. FLAS-F59071]
MRGYVVERWLKGPEELVLRDDVPEPSVTNLKEGEVIVDVKAIGLNFYEILMIQGKYQIKPPFPFIPGSELSGVIIAAHPSVKNYKVGDRVFGSNFSYAERIIIDTKNILPIPTNFSFEEAAGLYITYPTSYAALVLRAQLKQGEVCLIHAAAGGVGIAAVQIAK